MSVAGETRPKLRLVTIGVSHYCEKARWALDRAGARYVEERHAPMLHWAASFRHARQRTVPVLITPHGTLSDSTDILVHVDAWLDEPRRLYPHDEKLRREVEALEASFDEKLGPEARRYAYAWAVDEPAMFLRFVGQGVTGVEKRLLDVAHPVIRAAMRRAFKLDRPEQVKERTLARVRAVFDDVAARLREHGGPWLVGDRFTAADLTFAALSAPVIAPPGYGAELPTLAEMPTGLADTVRAMRATPGGELALRAYDEERRPAR